MEQVNEVVNENPMEIEEVNDDGGDEETIDNEPSDMDKLPPEILMKILGFLTERQLVKLRLVSSRWNEISCLLLQEKAKNNRQSRLIVHVQKCIFKSYVECKTTIKKSLDVFLDRFCPSEAEKTSGRLRPFPFSTFNIKCLTLKYMNSTQMREFLSAFGRRMKTVIVELRKDDISNFEGFWKLLLHFASNLERLSIIGDSSLKDVKLNPNFKATNPAETFLNNLKALEITSKDFGGFNVFMKELLDSAPNLEQVLSCDSLMRWNSELSHLKVWQELGKVHLLKTLNDLYSQSYFPPADLLKNLRLKNLTANCGVSSNFGENQKAMINNINHAIKSSQETLSNLHLYNLSLEIMNLCFKGISSLPNVRQLRTRAAVTMETGSILDRFSRLCPFVTSLELGFVHGICSNVATILFTKFQSLKSLHLSLTVDNGEYHSLALDSAFSGYSLESIQRIQSKLEEGVSMEEAREGESQNPSIFCLKDLVELQLMIEVNDVEWPELEEQVNTCLLIKMLPEYLTKNPMLLEFRRRSDSDEYDDPFKNVIIELDRIIRPNVCHLFDFQFSPEVDFDDDSDT